MHELVNWHHGCFQDPQPTHPVQSLITFFLCGWFITGCVWVYRWLSFIPPQSHPFLIPPFLDLTISWSHPFLISSFLDLTFSWSHPVLISTQLDLVLSESHVALSGSDPFSTWPILDPTLFRSHPFSIQVFSISPIFDFALSWSQPLSISPILDPTLSWSHPFLISSLIDLIPYWYPLFHRTVQGLLARYNSWGHCSILQPCRLYLCLLADHHCLHLPRFIRSHFFKKYRKFNRVFLFLLFLY